MNFAVFTSVYLKKYSSFMSVYLKKTIFIMIF